MTGIDGRDTKRWTWSPRHQANRIVYSLIAGWLVWLATLRPSLWVAVAVAVVAYVAMTVVLSRRR